MLNKKNNPSTLMLIMIISLSMILALLVPNEFYTSTHLSRLLHQIAVISVLSCGLTFLITLGHLDFSAGPILAFLSLYLRTADSVWHWNPILIFFTAFFFSVGIYLWHYYWVDVRHLPASFITSLSAYFFYLACNAFLLDKSSTDPYNLFFYILALNPLTNIEIYCIIITLFIIFFVLYYLSLSNRLHHKLAVDHWIPLIILTLSLMSLGLLGFMRIHKYVQFRLTFFIGVLTFVSFFIFERFSRLGRHIYTIGCQAQVAYETGIPVKKVRLIIWLSMGILIGILALFFRGEDTIFSPVEIIRIERIILCASFLGCLSPPWQKLRTLYSLIAVAFLVCLESFIEMKGFNPLSTHLASYLVLFSALYFSRFNSSHLN